MKKVFFFAGEHSGDLHGAHLLKALKENFPDAVSSGVAGPRMRQEGIETILEMEQFQVFGFTDILLKFPKIYRQFYKVRDYILKENPDAVVLIDYPGFNLRLARALRKKGYLGKLIQYNCPTIWAWGKGRKQTLIDNYDLVLSLFPFEPPLFKDTSLDVRFVGHPLAEAVQSHSYKSDFFTRFPRLEHNQIVTIYPGSREGEVKKHLAFQLNLCRHLHSRGFAFKIAISIADADREKQIREILAQEGFSPDSDVTLVPPDYSYELMRHTHTALAKSGTVTLELALHQVPAIVLYAVSLPNYLIGKYILRIDLSHYCIVNILCERTVYPEIIGRKLNFEEALNAVTKLLPDGPDRQACLDGCRETALLLRSAGQGVSHRAVGAIMESIG